MHLVLGRKLNRFFVEPLLLATLAEQNTVQSPYLLGVVIEWLVSGRRYRFDWFSSLARMQLFAELVWLDNAWTNTIFDGVQAFEECGQLR